MTQTLEELANDLDSIAASIERGYEETLRKFIPLMRADVQSHFDNAMSADGVPWPARKDNLPHPLLKLSLALEGAATGSGANHVEEFTDNEVTYGVEGIIYAARQNEGDEPGSVDSLGRPMRIPAREYMAISAGTADDMNEIAADDLLDRFEE